MNVTESDLVNRAESLSGYEISEVAAHLGWSMPENLRRDKGWLGQLIETALGATAGNLAVPDFPDLGIELKTIPVDLTGRPKESTFICSIDLLSISYEQFETSTFWQKCKAILWVPIETASGMSLGERRIRLPFLWRPSSLSRQILIEDWEELVDIMVMGGLETLTARQGQVLQVRPKAADASALCAGIGAEGETILTLPRGFYLRTAFTRRILAREEGV